MTRIESELHDLYECLMRNDDMADRDTYHTIVGIANDVAEVEADNAKLRKLVPCLLTCASNDCDCDRCPINGGTGIWQPESFCGELLDRMRELGIYFCGIEVK